MAATNGTATSKLVAIFNCNDHALAIDASHVDRLVLIDEVTVLSGGENGILLPATVRNEEDAYVGWDLGQLLGLGACSGAWVILRDIGSRTPIALRTGPCAGVRPLGHTFAVPRGVFRNRAHAFPMAFLDGAIEGIGLMLDPVKLLTAEEKRRTDLLGETIG